MKANLTLRGLDKATRSERGFIARWLKRQAKFIQPMHREFGPRYIARVMK
jgi:glutathione S-transferase